MRVGLDRGTLVGRAKPWAVHMVHGRARVHGDENASAKSARTMASQVAVRVVGLLLFP